MQYLNVRLQGFSKQYLYFHIEKYDSFLPFSPSPASLRVSSVSVVRSDHSSICVSWRPASAVSEYRIAIHSLKGNPWKDQ